MCMPIKNWGSHHCPSCGNPASRDQSYANGYCIPCGRRYYYRHYHLPGNPAKNVAKQRSYYRRNRAKVLARLAAYNQRLKRQVMAAYGNRCACCQETHLEFLAIDHIGGGRHGTIVGHKHRKSVSRGSNGGTNFYRWLRDKAFPAGYRVLCHNCNVSLGHFGYCPHTRQDSTSQ